MSISERLEYARIQQEIDRQKIAAYENDKNERFKAKFAREGTEYFFQPIITQLGKTIAPKEPVLAEEREPEKGQVAEAEGMEQPKELAEGEAAGIVPEGEGEKQKEKEEEEGAVGGEEEGVGEEERPIITQEMYEQLTAEATGSNKKYLKYAKRLAEGKTIPQDYKTQYLRGKTKEDVFIIIGESTRLGISPAKYEEIYYQGKEPKTEKIKKKTKELQVGSGANTISDRELVDAIKRFGGSIVGGNTSQEAKDFVEKGLWALADAGQISSNLFGKILKRL